MDQVTKRRQNNAASFFGLHGSEPRAQGKKSLWSSIFGLQTDLLKHKIKHLLIISKLEEEFPVESPESGAQNLYGYLVTLILG
jgi:hypothetical protein